MGASCPLEKVTEQKEEFLEEKQKIFEILNSSSKIKLQDKEMGASCPHFL